MTGPRKRTAAQDGMLESITAAYADEKAARALAEVEARALIDSRIQAARDRTTALMYKAHHEYGVTKAAITTLGVGSTNFQAVKVRMDEYARRMALAPGEELEVADLPTAAVEGAPSAVFVNMGEDGAVTVRFRNYSHPDLGSDLSGTVRFLDGGGGSRLYEDENEALAETVDSPFWGYNVFELPEVQEATK